MQPLNCLAERQVGVAVAGGPAETHVDHADPRARQVHVVAGQYHIVKIVETGDHGQVAARSEIVQDLDRIDRGLVRHANHVDGIERGRRDSGDMGAVTVVIQAVAAEGVEIDRLAGGHGNVVDDIKVVAIDAGIDDGDADPQAGQPGAVDGVPNLGCAHSRHAGRDHLGRLGGDLRLQAAGADTMMIQGKQTPATNGGKRARALDRRNRRVIDQRPKSVPGRDDDRRSVDDLVVESDNRAARADQAGAQVA